MPRLIALLVAAVVTLGTLTGCASEPTDDGKIHVVTGINVWADIAQTVGGDAVSVTSLIHDDSQDPHDYAAGAADIAAVADADIVIINGDGFDDFFGQLVDSANTAATIITVAELANTGLDNEHYWYDFPTVARVAEQIATAIAAIDPSTTDSVQASAESFRGQVEAMQLRATAIAAAHPGRSALLTEPLPYYLLNAAGFADVTPTGLTVAVESGSEIPATALRDSLALISGGTLSLLARNVQTDSAQVATLADAAASAGLAVMDFRELLPAGTSYVDWMTGYLTQIEALS